LFKVKYFVPNCFKYSTFLWSTQFHYEDFKLDFLHLKNCSLLLDREFQFECPFDGSTFEGLKEDNPFTTIKLILWPLSVPGTERCVCVDHNPEWIEVRRKVAFVQGSPLVLAQRIGGSKNHNPSAEVQNANGRGVIFRRGKHQHLSGAPARIALCTTTTDYLRAFLQNSDWSATKAPLIRRLPSARHKNSINHSYDSAGCGVLRKSPATKIVLQIA
jgi:hypothetical protein